MNRLKILVAALSLSAMSLVAQQTAQIEQLMDSAQYAEAEQLCTAELKKAPKNGRLYYWRSLAYFMQEEYGKALQDIDMIFKYAKTSGMSVSNIYELRAAMYEEIGENQKALDDYTTAIKKDKKNDRAYAQRGKLYYDLANYTAALADYQAASKLAPTNDNYLVEIARCLLVLGQVDEARATLTSVTTLYPNNANAWQLLSLLSLAEDKITESIDQQIRYLNLSYKNTGEFGDARLLVAAADTQYPYLLNAILEQIRQNTGYPKAFYRSILVLVYIEKEYYEDAIKELNTLETGTANPFILVNRAECYQKLYKYRKAITDYNALLQFDERYAAYRLNRGNCYLAIDDFTNAINDYSYVIQNIPSSANFGYYLRAMALVEQKKYDAALSDIGRAIELLPDAGLYIWQGRLHLVKGDTVQANADFEQVLALDTTYDNSVRQYALHYLGQDAEALAWMDSIIAENPSKGNYYDAACLNALMGRTEQALDAFEKSISMGYRNFHHIAYDADLDSIRNLPRFTEILDKCHQQEVQRKFDQLQEISTSQKE